MLLKEILSTGATRVAAAIIMGFVIGSLFIFFSSFSFIFLCLFPLGRHEE
jgi:hypothetical protein